MGQHFTGVVKGVLTSPHKAEPDRLLDYYGLGFLTWCYFITSVYYFTLPFILFDLPTDEGSNHKGQRWPRDALSTYRSIEEQGLLCMEGEVERRNGQTPPSGLLLAWVFIMNGEKSKSGKQGLVFGL